MPKSTSILASKIHNYNEPIVGYHDYHQDINHRITYFYTKDQRNERLGNLGEDYEADLLSSNDD